MRTIAIMLLSAVAVGCLKVSDRIPAHTHLWTEKPLHNVWSYQPVIRIATGENVAMTNSFLSMQLLANETVELSNGVSVTFDGMVLQVGGIVIPTNILNMVIAPDGELETNAFIRTFW